MTSASTASIIKMFWVIIVLIEMGPVPKKIGRADFLCEVLTDAHVVSYRLQQLGKEVW